MNAAFDSVAGMRFWKKDRKIPTAVESNYVTNGTQNASEDGDIAFVLLPSPTGRI